MWTVISDFITDIRETGSRLLKNHRSGIWVTILTVILAYGFKLTHVSYNNDTSFALASLPLGLVSQKRFGHVIFSLSGILDQMVPFWSDMVGLLILLIAAFILRMTLERKFGDLFSPWKLTISSLLFLTYPLHMEFFLYPCGIAMMALGYTLTFASIYFFIQQNKRKFLLSILFLVIAVGIYEVFIFVFVTTALGLLCIEIVSHKEESWKEVLIYVRKLCVVFLGTILIYGIFFFLIGLRYSFSGGNAEKSILWFEKSFFSVVISLFTKFGYDYFYNSLFYLPILVFVILVLGVLILPFTRSLKGRRCLCGILLYCFLISCFILFVLQGGATSYRSMQTIAVFLSLSSLLFMHISPRPNIIMFFILCIVFFQTKEISLISYTDYYASEHNVVRIEQMARDVRSRFGYSPVKPIYVIGKQDFPLPWSFTLTYFDKVTRRLPKCNYTSKSCSMICFGGSDVFPGLVKSITDLKVLRCSKGSAQYKKLKCYLKERKQPQWPVDGYIQEYDDCILINLGQSIEAREENRK